MDAPGKAMGSGQQQHQQQQHLQQQQQQQLQRQKASLQLAYQDALKVCHPDTKRPFSSLEDACERLLPYHVVADYEAEEDDKILDSASATTGEPTPILSRSQQWDNNIAAKVAEFTNTFEKQVLAFNIISRKRALGEFRTEEKLMVEQLLLQDERQKFLELRAQMVDKRQRVHEAGETHMGEMMGRGPIRGSSSGSFGAGGGSGSDNNVFGPPRLGEQDQEEFNEDDAVNGWGGDVNKDDDKEPSEDFLNDDEAGNGGDDSASHGGVWRGGGGGGGGSGELDLNAR